MCGGLAGIGWEESGVREKVLIGREYMGRRGWRRCNGGGGRESRPHREEVGERKINLLYLHTVLYILYNVYFSTFFLCRADGSSRVLKVVFPNKTFDTLQISPH